MDDVALADGEAGRVGASAGDVNPNDPPARYLRARDSKSVIAPCTTSTKMTRTIVQAMAPAMSKICC